MAEEWQEWLDALVTESDEKARKKLAKKLRKFITSHASATSGTSDAKEEVVQVESAEEKSSKKSSKSKSSTKQEDDDVVKAKDESESRKNGKKTAAKHEEPTTSVKKAKVVEEPEEEQQEIGNGSDVDKSASEKKRFSRVDEQKALKQALIHDNTYEATFGSDGYGAKANEKLKQVRGKDFRHEKTKKKRGSYRGGAIDENVVRSVDFDSE